MQNLCRLCALEKVYQIPIFTETGVDIGQRIEKLVQVTVSADDVLPKTICTECLANVNSYNDFVFKCTQAQFVLKALCGIVLKHEEDEEQPSQSEPPQNVTDDIDLFASLPDADVHSDDGGTENYPSFVEIEVLPDGSLLRYDQNDFIEESSDVDVNVEVVAEDDPRGVERSSKQLHEESRSEPSSDDDDKDDREDDEPIPASGSCDAQESNPTSSTHSRKTRLIFRQLQCCECNAVKRGPKQLQLHFRTTHKRNVVFLCPTCSKRFEKYRSFTRHVILHKEGPRFVCEVCDKSFGQKVQLQNHIAIHTNKSRYQCDECGKKYRHITSLYKHVRNHSGYKVICEICSQEFTSKDALRNHKKAFHIVERTEICKKCGLAFSTRPALYYHLKWHAKSEAGIQFSCPLCYKDFDSRALLQQHHTTHVKIEIQNLDISESSNC